jgi:uncharacterized protein YjiS (DUF1127 family)
MQQLSVLLRVEAALWRRLGQTGRQIAELVTIVELWAERRRQRRALAELSDHTLHDIGISRAEAWREAQKPFWRR